jgi:hypothetical protein
MRLIAAANVKSPEARFITKSQVDFFCGILTVYTNLGRMLMTVNLVGLNQELNS